MAWSILPSGSELSASRFVLSGLNASTWERKGLALPGYIFLTEAAANETVLCHEIVHQKQMLRYTPLGVAIYLGWHYGKGIVSHYMQHGRLPRFVDLWATNPLEVEANSLMCSKAPLPRVSGWPFPK